MMAALCRLRGVTRACAVSSLPSYRWPLNRLGGAARALGSTGRGGAHDVGGVESLLGVHVSTSDRPLLQWERETNALLIALVRKRKLTTDELRRCVEALEPEAHAEWGYFDKWAAAIGRALVERGEFTGAQLDSALGLAIPPIDPLRPRFRPGDRVRVRVESAPARWRKPHVRVPGYLFGAVGTVASHEGAFADPSFLALGPLFPAAGDEAAGGATRQPIQSSPIQSSPPQANGSAAPSAPELSPPAPEPGQSLAAAPLAHLYRVTFSQAELWPAYEGSARDLVNAEVYEPWLVPAPPPSHGSGGNTLATQRAIQPPHDVGNGDAATHSEHEHSHSHSHGHAHVHLPRAEAEARAAASEPAESIGERMVAAIVQLLAERGVVRPGELRAIVDQMDTGPAGVLPGQRLIARAWLDPSFKARLLDDATAAAAELGISAGNPNAATVLKVVECTEAEHQIVVCTLCSCYPAALLGPSPAWYKSAAYRARAVREPRALLADSFGLQLPATTSLRVHDSTADLRFCVLPLRPEGTEGLSEEELYRLVTRDTMVGVAQCQLPAQLAAADASPPAIGRRPV
jgi:nitrile hydratase